MANNFDKTTTLGTDRTLVLGQREALIYPFPFTDWNVIRIGAYLSLTTATEDNGDVSALGGPNTEFSINPVAAFNERYFFGVKHNNSNFPGTNSEVFAGLVNNSVASKFSVLNSPGRGFQFGDNFGNQINSAVVHSNGTMQNTSSGGLAYSPMAFNGNFFHDTQNFAFFLGMTLEMSNKGTSSQKINISSTKSNSLNVTNTGNTNLKNDLTNSTYTNHGIVDWQNSGIPYALPNTFFFYFPFTNARLRVHNIGIVKVS